jgi:50S ribosomal protein L16 3-hydroxylase
MTYSFGYRSYTAQELWESLGDYLAEHQLLTTHYTDPDWSTLSHGNAVHDEAWKNARHILQNILQQDSIIKNWFSCFATQLDQSAEQTLPPALDEEETLNLDEFTTLCQNSTTLCRDNSCRFAWIADENRLFINGVEWDLHGAHPQLSDLLANKQTLSIAGHEDILLHPQSQLVLYELWKRQWIYLEE